ncbi:MAG: cytochrome c-type biogenesis protein CcmH [Alphaproteobacteria bacterium]|nr:cytochrome c-type biogenesis protein CcmH [Alphaproteobacteria bacterium]
MRILLSASMFCFFCAAAWAFTPDVPLADGAQESRARELFQQLRCAVCQSESLNESQAEVARDMRRAVRERIAAGQTDGEILAYLQSRYGESILMRPPFTRSTALLWGGPLLVCLLGGGIALAYFRNSRHV